MRAKLTIDKKFIQLYEISDYELKQLKISFTKKINNWFIIRRKSPFANVDESFINKYNMIPIGLWVELVKIATKYKLNLIFDEDFDNSIKDNLLTIDNIKSYCNNLFKNSEIQPYDYQIDAVYKMLKYKKCCVEISTSGGKTLISYIYFKYLHDVCGFKHFLYVTPNTTLTTQSGEKFKQYDKKCGIESDWTFEEIHSGQKKKSEYNATIVFGNYQSLCKKKSDFFDKYECVIQDECLHPKTLITMGDGTKKEIQNIKIGDKVITYNEITKNFEINEVDYVYKNLSKNEQMFEFELENGNIIKITGNHKVLLKTGKWKRADELCIDDDIIDFNYDETNK